MRYIWLRVRKVTERKMAIEVDPDSDYGDAVQQAKLKFLEDPFNQFDAPGSTQVTWEIDPL